MADKPSRALVIYGDGHAPLVSPSHSHLHSFATRASCGFLSLRSPPPAGETENVRVVQELAQLLDAYDFSMAADVQGDEVNINTNLKETSVQTISHRFMGLRAAIVTNCSVVKSFATKLGLSALQITELIKQAHSVYQYQEITGDFCISSELMKLLGFSGGDVLEKFDFDLVLLHIKPSKKTDELEGNMVIDTDVDWINKLVGGIMQVAQPGSIVASRLHLSVLLGFGTVSQSDSTCSLISNSSTESNSDLSLLRPCQSYTMKGGNKLDDIRHHYPLLIAQWQDGVTRRDMAAEFSFEEFRERGGNLAILADRFLHEVAFKLWKAPKYGA